LLCGSSSISRQSPTPAIYFSHSKFPNPNRRDVCLNVNGSAWPARCRQPGCLLTYSPSGISASSFPSLGVFKNGFPPAWTSTTSWGRGIWGWSRPRAGSTREDFERKVTPHWIGRVVRRKLGLKTEKRHGSYVVAATEGPKLARLFEKYGVSTGQGDLGDSGDFAGGEETAAPSTNQPII